MGAKRAESRTNDGNKAVICNKTSRVAAAYESFSILQEIPAIPPAALNTSSPCPHVQRDFILPN
jgi:hypothetical protein